MSNHKMKLGMFSFIAIILLGLIAFAAPEVNAAPTLNLPTVPVQTTWTWDESNLQFTSVVFSGMGASFDVKNNTPYIGWCVERLSGPDPDGKTFSVNLYSSYDPNLPVNLTQWGARTIPWDKINWVLNNKGSYSPRAIAGAVWGLVEGSDPGVDPNSAALIAAADANGGGFVPVAGQKVAVILTNGSGITDIPDTWQENIIEVTLSTTTAVTLSSFSADVSGNEMVPAGLVIPALGVSLLGIVAVLGIWKFGLRRA